MEDVQGIFDRGEQVRQDPQQIANEVASRRIRALEDRGELSDVATASNAQNDPLTEVDHLARRRFLFEDRVLVLVPLPVQNGSDGQPGVLQEEPRLLERLPDEVGPLYQCASASFHGFRESPKSSRDLIANAI